MKLYLVNVTKDGTAMPFIDSAFCTDLTKARQIRDKVLKDYEENGKFEDALEVGIFRISTDRFFSYISWLPEETLGILKDSEIKDTYRALRTEDDNKNFKKIFKNLLTK